MWWIKEWYRVLFHPKEMDIMLSLIAWVVFIPAVGILLLVGALVGILWYVW